MNRNRLGCIFAGVVCLAFWPSVAFGQIEASPKVDPCKDPNVRTDVRPNVGGPNCWHCISMGSAGRQLPSRPGEFHPEPLTEPDVILSHHPAHAITRRLPPSAEQAGSSRHNRLAQVQRR